MRHPSNKAGLAKTNKTKSTPLWATAKGTAWKWWFCLARWGEGSEEENCRMGAGVFLGKSKAMRARCGQGALIIPSNTHKNKLVTSAGLTFSGNSNHNPPFQGPSFQTSWRQVLRSHETLHPRPVYAHAPGFGGVASSCFLHRLMCFNSVCVLSSLATSGLGQSLFR